MTHELYMKMAESLKKLLVSELSSWFGDMETMVASANRAFETLDWLQPDCTEFYDAVRALLSRHAQLSSLETVLQTHQNEEESDASNFQARSKEALARSEAKYKKPINPNPENQTRKSNTQTQKMKPEKQKKQNQ